MNKITLEQMQPNVIFTEDAYILDDLFFFPKDQPVYDYHLKILSNWNIDTILTEGTTSIATAINKIVKEKPTAQDKLDKLMETKPKDGESEEMDKLLSKDDDEDDAPLNFESNGIKTDALLDSSVKGFFELYKKWIKDVVGFFNDILLNNINKEKVKNFILEIVSAVNKNRNNALMLFGKKLEGILHVFPQTIETIILAYLIGDSLQLSQLALSNLAIATLFHDLGMLKIPKSILEKKEKLTPQEIKIIQEHTTIGFKLLRQNKYSAIIASGALQHHERIDGKGYPNGLTPDKVTGLAKIISVVDAYCAAIASKPFKDSPLHAKEAIQDLLTGGGSAYDPAILKELIKNISFYPIGSLVLLSNEIPARVVGTSGIAMRPIVRIIKDNIDGEIYDLSQKNDIYIKGLYVKKEESKNNS